MELNTWCEECGVLFGHEVRFLAGEDRVESMESTIVGAGVGGFRPTEERVKYFPGDSLLLHLSNQTGH